MKVLLSRVGFQLGGVKENSKTWSVICGGSYALSKPSSVGYNCESWGDSVMRVGLVRVWIFNLVF